MFSNRFKELESAVEACTYTTVSGALSEHESLSKALKMIEQVCIDRGIVYVIGNGGSAGIASHFATDLIKSMKVPAQTLYDSNLMTCLGNDYGYETVFSYPLGQLLKPNDLLVAISSSGKSPNIVKAAETAVQSKAKLITLSGFSEENPLRQLGDLNFWINRKDYGLVETAHFFLLHTIVDFWNKRSLMENTHAEVFTNARTEDQALTRN